MTTTSVTARRPGRAQVAKLVATHTEVVVHFDTSVTVIDARAYAAYFVGEVEKIRADDLTASGDHLILKIERTISGSHTFDNALLARLREVVPARVIWSAKIDVNVDRAPNRIHIGTTVQLTYGTDAMPDVTADGILANVPGVANPEVLKGQIVVGMATPSYDPTVVGAFVDALLAYLQTALTNADYKVFDEDRNAQRYPEMFDWRPRAESDDAEVPGATGAGEHQTQ
jgi:hypothetical protein